ncbi:Redoxin [Multifurca ochricompacta]|uniref:Redoxin n=1 Tax=Multifurca ochricompacta TaxID=376703 RepID=A0AAD4QKH0_9AGAM|nr:Redoxin [Multifurca ochricompacta]
MQSLSLSFIYCAPSSANVVTKNKKVGVPGAFTPSCSSQVPGYIEKYNEFKEKGINEIYVVTVNDAFVTKAWKEKLAPNGTLVRFISDDQALFVSALGLILDATVNLGAPRAKRFVIVSNDDVIERIIVEEDSSQVTTTAADSVLASL